jgi:4-hydroxybenzoate polyprenyltransferase
MSLEICLLLVSLVPALVLALAKPNLFRELCADLRPGRILHYFVLFLFGFVLFGQSYDTLAKTETVTWLRAGIYGIVLIYAAVFAIATNNREDIAIDRITNQHRPLVRNAVDPVDYIRVSRISLVIAFAVAACAGWEFLAAIAGISGIYYLYSCRPFKLKRFVILAKFLIGINSLISAVCGFYVAGGELRDFPPFWAVFILVPVSLMANFVDLKDTEGDKAAGIRTLPVIWGEHAAKTLIGLFTVSAYVFVFVYFRSFWISWLLLATCSVHVYLLFRKPYNEKPLFLLHNSLFIGLIILVLARPLIPN